MEQSKSHDIAGPTPDVVQMFDIIGFVVQNFIHLSGVRT